MGQSIQVSLRSAAKVVASRSPATRRCAGKVDDALPYRLRRWVRPSAIDDAIHAYGVSRGSLFFVQLGANDGRTNDVLHRFIREFAWFGLVVEPSPVPHSRLLLAYSGNTRVKAVQCAASANATSENLTFFFVTPRKGDPAYVDQIGSLDVTHVLKHTKVPAVAQRVETMQVPVRTFHELCDAESVSHADLVSLDIEGLDAEVLLSLPLQKFGISAVLFEHLHFNEQERTAVKKHLSQAGFRLAAETQLDAFWTT